MSLDAYAAPLAVTQGTWIALDQAPEIAFRVLAPVEENWLYQLALLDEVPRPAPKLQADGSPDEASLLATIKTSTMMQAQRIAFAKVCVVEARGLPKKYATIAAFFDAYPLALAEIQRKATSAGSDKQGAAVAALGNSRAA